MLARVYFTIDRAPRRELKTAGTVRRDGYPETVQIDNLSISGVHVTTDLAFDVDEIVTMGIPGIGAHLTRIVRKSETGYGCAFLRALDQGDVDRADANTIASEPGAARAPVAPVPHAPALAGRLAGAIGAVCLVAGAIAVLLMT